MAKVQAITDSLFGALEIRVHVHFPITRRLRAAERRELTSVIDRLWRRFLERLDTIYDTC